MKFTIAKTFRGKCRPMINESVIGIPISFSLNPFFQREPLARSI